jgi:hypothetical protein
LRSPNERNDRSNDRASLVKKPNPNEKAKRIPCSQAIREPGGIFAVAADLSGVFGGGATAQGGIFINRQTGTFGIFINGGGAVGSEVAGGGQVIGYRSARDFFGSSWTIAAAGAGLQGSVSYSSLSNIFNIRNIIGGSFGGAIGAGVSISRTNTTPLICWNRGG